MSLSLLYLALSSAVFLTMAEAEDTCQMTITVSAQQVQSLCQSRGPPQAIVGPELAELRADNARLRTDLDEMRGEYGDMVDTVRRLNEETASWREIVQWPLLEPVFKPDNETLYIDPDGPTYKDCQEAIARNRKQGIYSLKPESSGSQPPFLAYCDEEGWTVIQRRFDGSVDFFRSWDDYMSGFGRLGGEFWLGLEGVHRLTSQGDNYVLDMEALGYNNKLYHSKNPGFRLLGEQDEFRMFVGNQTAGNYRDMVADLNGTAFSTKDNDNDDWWNDNCALQYRGGFWLKDCGWDLNREYCDGPGCMSFGERPIKKSLLKIRVDNGAGPATGPGNRQGQPAPQRPNRNRNRNRGAGGRRNRPDRESG